jgi:Mrp family chromosome partitioning ATPase
MFGRKKEASQAEILSRLKTVMDPELDMPIVDLGMLRGFVLRDGVLDLDIALTVDGCPLKDRIQSDVRKAVQGLAGFQSVQVRFQTMPPEELAALKERLGREKSSQIMSQAPAPSRRPLGDPHNAGGINRLEKKVPNILAVTSGKGGVGKSSVTSMLAVSLGRLGQKVGILDADITGPSIARIFGTRERPEVKGEDTLVPVPTSSGVRVLSMNLLIAEEKAPVIWRGPLVNGAIRQLYGNAEWEGLDWLLVDLPPGTSDANLTVFQSIPLDGVLIVTSPQDLVRMIVAKSISMAKQLRVPVAGLVENMAFLPCPHCQEVIRPYGPSQGAAAAEAAGIPFLGSLPIDPKLAQACDQGKIGDYQNPGFEKMAEVLLAGRASALR